jgi:hypothetical protein
MKTDDLITAIAQDAGARAMPMTRRLVAASGLACVLAAVALVATIGVRPDIWKALGTWRFDTKLLSVAAILLGAWYAARQLSRPEANARAALPGAALPVLVLVLAMGAELLSSPAETWGARAVGSNARLCLVAILGLAVAPLVVLLGTMRAGAPRSPSLAGAAAGLMAGAIGALFYAIHCPDDSPLFVALWYTPPILAMTALGAIAGSRLLRW